MQERGEIPENFRPNILNMPEDPEVTPIVESDSSDDRYNRLASEEPPTTSDWGETGTFTPVNLEGSDPKGQQERPNDGETEEINLPPYANNAQVEAIVPQNSRIVPDTEEETAFDWEAETVDVSTDGEPPLAGTRAQNYPVKNTPSNFLDFVKKIAGINSDEKPEE